ncbi:MAG: hypothetical protein HGA59_05190 [Chlorobiaceae bacterium]|jgi:hypothetical protein|nr:hypothetical protein [Chlorobiaceae bacterium]NTV15816.1 hypothetical protein [Chlorobiaceae bacterium]
MHSTGAEKQAAILEQQKMIGDLKERFAENERVLTRAETANTDNVLILFNLLDHVQALEIDSGQKKVLTDVCLRLIEAEETSERLNIELSESDALFLFRLEKKHPNLDNRELKVCLFIKLDYDNEAIAKTSGVKNRGMESIRYKLHKKLGLGKNVSIKNYLTELTFV